MSEFLADARPSTDTMPPLLDRLTRALERHARGADLAWLRALLVVSAEIEFTLTRAPRLNVAVLADESRDLRELLTRPSAEQGDFAERYAAARAESQDLRTLHELVLVACAALAEPELRSAASTVRASTAVDARDP
jgi:hypothetical protein